MQIMTKSNKDSQIQSESSLVVDEILSNSVCGRWLAGARTKSAGDWDNNVDWPEVMEAEIYNVCGGGVGVRMVCEERGWRSDIVLKYWQMTSHLYPC